MIIRNVELETVCGVTSKLPENILPEFAFCLLYTSPSPRDCS